MTEVQLHGSNGKRTLKLPSTAPATKANPNDNTKAACTIHRKAAFATMRKLRPHLKALGSSEDAVWKGIKRKANVTSRANLTASNWAIIAAELKAALQNKDLLAALVRRYDLPLSVRRMQQRKAKSANEAVRRLNAEKAKRQA